MSRAVLLEMKILEKRKIILIFVFRDIANKLIDRFPLNLKGNGAIKIEAI